MSSQGEDVREPEGLASEWEAPTGVPSGSSPARDTGLAPYPAGSLTPWRERPRWYAPARRNGRYIGAAVVLSMFFGFWAWGFVTVVVDDPANPVSWVMAAIALIATGLALWGAVSNARKP